MSGVPEKIEPEEILSLFRLIIDLVDDNPSAASESGRPAETPEEIVGAGGPGGKAGWAR